MDKKESRIDWIRSCVAEFTSLTQLQEFIFNSLDDDNQEYKEESVRTQCRRAWNELKGRHDTEASYNSNSSPLQKTPPKNDKLSKKPEELSSELTNSEV